MKLAIFTLMSCCLIALSWQQQQHHHHHRQPAANPYWPLSNYYHQQQQQLPYYYQDQNYNHPSFNPYYRGPYISPPAQSQQAYYQAQQQQQHQVPQRSQLDELKLAALLSQLGQQQQQPQQQQENEKQESKQKQLDLDLLNQLNKDSVFIAQHQDLDPFADPEAVKQVFSNSDESETKDPKTEDSGASSQDSTQQQAAVAPTGEIEGRAKLAALLLGYQIFTTSTSYKFVTSTVTTTNYISCIVSASFYGGSTQACRRKRFVPDIEADEDQMPFNPSPVNTVEPTASYDELDRHSRSADELLSSFNEQPEDRAKMSQYDSFVRANRGIGLGTTLTSTITSYSFTTTASYKTIKIGSSLSCLPSGYSIC